MQAVHEDLRYVLSIEVAPSAANGYTAQEVEVPFMNGWNVTEWLRSGCYR